MTWLHGLIRCFEEWPNEAFFLIVVERVNSFLRTTINDFMVEFDLFYCSKERLAYCSVTKKETSQRDNIIFKPSAELA